MYNLCIHAGPSAQKSPALGLMFCGRHLEIVNNFWTRGSVVSFCIGAPSYAAGPEYSYLILPTISISFPTTTFIGNFRLAFGVIRYQVTTQLILLFLTFSLLHSFQCSTHTVILTFPCPGAPFLREDVHCYFFVNEVPFLLFQNKPYFTSIQLNISISPSRRNPSSGMSACPHGTLLRTCSTHFSSHCTGQ